MRNLILALAFAVTACDNDIVGPRELARLADAEARWNARGFADYSYEIRTFCFCPPEINRWTRVTVRGGVVVDAEAVEPDPNFPISTLSLWVPVDSLFANLHRAMTSNESDIYLDAIVVAYDQALGFPTSIEYRAKKNIADGGSTTTVRNVIPLN
jgi:hypothetical protein